MAFDVDLLMRLWDGPGETEDFRTAYADPVLLNGQSVPLSTLATMARGLHAALADQRREIIDVVSAPGKVAVAFVVHGRHVGPLSLRLGVVPATGRTIAMSVIDIFTLVDGLITEVRAVSDELGLLSGLDAVALSRTA